MKKLLTFTFVFAVCLNNILSQSNVILNSVITPGNYTAQQEIRLKPNMLGSPTGVNQMHLYIDPTIPVNANAPNSTSTFGIPPVNNNLDLSKPVGSIPYSFNVSPVGSAECSIPIEVPVGTNNMKPSLSLNYSSMSNNGELGNWFISGMQSITRMPQTLYHNNNIRTVDLSNADVYSLNGNRLIPATGANGANSTTYNLEQYGFDRITSYGSIGNGPSWFKVETKDGLIKEFGNSSDSRLIPLSQTTVYEWKLNKISDQNGNYVEYIYNNSNGECTIKEIKYTGNSAAGIVPYNSVKFYYNLIDEKNSVYLNGGELKRNSILRQIELYSENNFVCQYNFDYTKYFNNTYLTEVKLKGNDYTELNSLKLSYQNDTGNPVFQNSNGLAGNYFKNYQLVDFNGDGLKDVIAFNGFLVPASNSSPIVWQNWTVHKNIGNSAFTQINQNTFPSNFSVIDYFPVSKNVVGSMIYSSYDFNGDHKEDLLLRGTTGNNDVFNFYFSNGNSGFTSTPSKVISLTTTNSTPISQNSFWIVDLDGDQKLDLLYYDNTNSGGNNYDVKIWLDIANTTGTPNHVLSTTQFKIKDARPMDIDGDGKTELLVESTTGTNNFSILSINSSNQLFTNTIPYSSPLSYNQVNYKTFTSPNGYFTNTFYVKLDGDFNGDGKTDYILSQQMGPSSPTPSLWKYEMFINKGDNTYSSPILLNKSGLGLLEQPTISNSSNSSIIKGYYYTTDMNNDGKTDIVEISGANISVYFSKGLNGDYFSKETYTIPNTYNLNIIDFQFADIDGNGVTDIYSSSSVSFNVPFIMYFYKGEKSKLINEIADGFGKKTQFSFKSMSDATSYTNTQSKVYPVSVPTIPMFLVNSVSSSNGIGGNNIIDYKYENLLVHKGGKGLIGFAKVTKTDVTSSAKQVDEYDFNIVNFNLFSVKTSIYNIPSNTLLNEQIPNYQNITVSGKSYWQILNNTTTNNLVSNSTSFHEYAYDSNGNVVLDRIKINNTFDVDETYYSGFVSNGSWLPTKPTSVLKFITRTGKPSVNKTYSYAYDAKGNVITETNEPSNPKSLVTNNTYDANTGVLLSKDVSSPSSGFPNKLMSYQYDTKYRIPIKEYNSLGQHEEFEYNFIWAKPIKKTNLEGLVTLITYDGYGRIKSIKSPDNNIVSYNYDWVTPADFVGGDPLNTNNCLYKIKKAKIGFPESIEYFDMFNRKIRNENGGFNSKEYQQSQYDAIGNIISQTGPYHLVLGNTFIPLITTNTYDNLNRLTNVSESDGTTTKNTSMVYTYNNGDITITSTAPDGKITSKTTDASGLIKTVVDNGGTISYDYYSNRLPSTILVNGLQSNYFEYDINFKQTKLIDKDAGITLYNYNAFGELISKTDANNHTYNYTYDALSRITNKVGPDGNYAFQYVNYGIGLNKIQQETAPNGYYKKYYYDILSRNNKVEENIGGQNYITEFTFDQYNRLDTKKYPSGFTTKNVYTFNGMLSQIKNQQNNQAIWQCTKVNPLGQVSEYLSGNGALTQNTYNNFGLPVQLNTAGIQVLNYNFNITNGNLVSRTDGILNKTESFVYDNLDRLTQVQISSLPNFNVTYNNSGNVLTKTGLGAFTYKSNKPDAINTVDNTNGLISSNQQDITFTSFNKVQTIIEDIYQYNIFYGVDQERSLSTFYVNGNLDKTRTYVGAYEKTEQGSNTLEINYINTPSGTSAMYVVNNGVGTMYYTYQDYLGNVLKVTNSVGAVVANLNYDAWGRRRNSTTWDYSSPTQPPNWLYRVYTGHEHLDAFALIDMNGRFYDPILGQMLSPDPFNQKPGYTQNFNRYAYAFNNPLKFNDPSGNIFGTVFGFLKGAYDVITGGGLEFWNGKSSYVSNAWDKAGNSFKNGLRIDAGLFKTDPNRTFGGRAIQFISRFTWELPQTILGDLYSGVRNGIGEVTDVSYYGGATLVNQKNSKKGFQSGLTLGSFINSVNLEADPYKSEIFRHEYGHTLQSRMVGLLYLPFVAAPSFVGAFLDYNVGINNHDEEWYEVNANRMAKRYFTNHDKNSLDPSKGGIKWDNSSYPTKYVFNWYTIPSILIGGLVIFLIL